MPDVFLLNLSLKFLVKKKNKKKSMCDLISNYWYLKWSIMREFIKILHYICVLRHFNSFKWTEVTVVKIKGETAKACCQSLVGKVELR